ncbi:hypothetical protein [Nocardiopsis dassonvillei]|uniref:hypothetical protein n=1 Tax=Nocardiopsis dassonvillei TaxID=2014 RepID=UPI00363A3270
MNEIDNPNVRYLVSLLAMLPGDWRHPMWRSLGEDQEHPHNVCAQLRPLVRMLGEREGRAGASLAYEVLDVFSNPSEATRRLIGAAVTGSVPGLRVADVWLGELLATAIRVRADGMSKNLGELATTWCADTESHGV